jgi:hypothetical protein
MTIDQLLVSCEDGRLTRRELLAAQSTLAAAGCGCLGTYPAQGNTPPAITHFCLDPDQFDANRTLEQLNDAGVKAHIRMRGDVEELYLTDPDGISVQLQDVSHKG